jgi:LDH2 family malate/lactate/ureidoglycolate dehydrogenase
MTTRYPLPELHRFIVDVLVSYDVLPDHATTVAERMLEADLRGQDGHGVFRLPPYCRRLEEGGYNLRPDIRLTHDSSVRALVDGDGGFGQVVVTEAVRIAIDKAGEHGLAWVGTHNSNHAGAGGVYARMALEHDLIGIYMAIGNANHAPAWGGLDMLLSTNPMAFAIPAGEEPGVVLDMATTVASYGRIKVYADRGEELPVGWLEDRTGTPITDPKRAAEGLLTPIGGYKGYGLNLVVGALAGVLNGAAFGSEVIDFNKDFRTPTNTGQMMIVMRPDLFGTVEDFKASMDVRIRELKASEPMPGRGPVRIPGDSVPGRERDMRANGVPIAGPVVERLTELATRRGVDVSVLA